MTAAPRRFLLVEDEYLVAVLIEDMLAELGHELAATAARFDDGLALAQTARFDLALLDLQLGAQATYPIADALGRRGIPFAFVTGRARSDVAAAYAATPILGKPFRLADLAAIIERLVGAGPA
jgi:CheY-like chemotaxis protein